MAEDLGAMGTVGVVSEGIMLVEELIDEPV